MSSFSNNESRLTPFGHASTGLPDPGDASVMQAHLENQSLKAQIVTQTQLTHLLTHQLATPLTALGGSVDLLADPDLAVAHRQEFLVVVQQQVQRLQNLLQDLKSLRNLETGTLETNPVSFCLKGLVEEVVGTLPGSQVGYNLSADLPLVRGDRWQISQVLINLLSNAVKYSPDDGLIEVGAARQPSGWVEVWVRDHGLGIPASDQPHLFERFYRVQHRDRHTIQGTGLGLSLCKLLVENQGGQIGFESTHGEGSRFYFTLPASDR